MSENGKTVFSCKKDYEGTVVIPEGVTWIRDDAFVGCTNLKEILVDENNLDYCSKDGVLYSKLMSILYVVPCYKDSIEIPEYVLVIKDHAFEGCSNLKSITIPEGVPVIWAGTFQGCTSLISITIPSSVATIQSWAFRRCTSLKEIHLKHKNPKNFAEAFKDIDPSNITIYVPKGSGKAYRNSIHYKSFKTIIEEE